MQAKKTNASTKSKKVRAANNNAKPKTVQTLSNSPLRRKPGTRKRVLQRPPATKPNKIEDKRKELMEAIDQTVRKVQDFKQDLHDLTNKYPVVVVVKKCDVDKAHVHASVHFIKVRTLNKMRSRHTTDVALPILANEVLISPENGNRYYPLLPAVATASLFKRIANVLKGKEDMTEERVKAIISQGVESFVMLSSNNIKASVAIPAM